ncbi:hypothetical protein C8R44DRAFT_741674 [Mycena epipterygia]|nr:hypothetical protein C8R44DRAFT_741674 [Mycena epipterygia]
MDVVSHAAILSLSTVLAEAACIFVRARYPSSFTAVSSSKSRRNSPPSVRSWNGENKMYVGEGYRTYGVQCKDPASSTIDGHVFSREGIIFLLAGAAAMFIRVTIHNSRSQDMTLLPAIRSRSRRKRQDHDVVRTIRRELEQERRNIVKEVGKVSQSQVLRTLELQLCQRGS